jgi:hypothetical protein
MHADYVLTTFSPAMFGERATAHIKIIPQEVAQSLLGEETRVVATRVSHDRLARTQLPGAHHETARYAQLKPGIMAIHLHYRGPAIGEDGRMPVGGMCTFYLIDVEEYQEPA